MRYEETVRDLIATLHNLTLPETVLGPVDYEVRRLRLMHARDSLKRAVHMVTRELDNMDADDRAERMRKALADRSK